MAPDQSLEAQVRAGDEDRWLAARFVADPARRAELVALYALNLEIARVAESVTNPLMGEIRLAWWSEGLDEIAADGAARAPVLEALRGPAREGRLDRRALDGLIEARQADLSSEGFADEPALATYLHQTASGLMAAAAGLLAPGVASESLASAGLAWGWARWLEGARRQGFTAPRWRPATWAERAPDEIVAHVARRSLAALAEARRDIRALPVAAFPAVAYAVFAPNLARGRAPGGLARRVRLTRAVLTGRL